tara:strand:- start:802 stop:1080 length:279 start_codon:yes stop_codon:yes gene_type:complete
MTTEEQTENQTLSRFDFTDAQQDFLLHVVRCNDVIDAIDLGCIIANHGANFEAIADEILEAYFVSRHWDHQDRHSEIARNLERAKRLDETKA